MATRIRVRRLANPRRRVNVKRRNATKRRRKMSPKQIRIFGTRAQKAALKRKRKRNPVARKVSAPKRVNRKRRTRRSNPALVVTLGAMNPRRKKRRNKPVAATRKNRRRRRVNTATRTNRRRRRNPVARRTNRRRRRNATRIVVVAPKQNRRRRRNPSRRNRRRVHHRRRNPMNTSLFGAPLFGKSSLELVGGGLVGVAAAKFIPTLLPTSLTGGVASSNIGRTIITGIAAVVGGWAGSKVSPQFGQGMLFGGMMQTLSVALNAFLPSVYGQLSPYSSLGDLMPGGFSVPQNPLRLPPPPPAALPPSGSQARMNMNGLARAYGSAF